MKSKRYWIGGIIIIIMGIGAFLSDILSTNNDPVAESVYDFKLNALDGKVIDFGAFKGKKILIVNTASKCGKTPQYKGLEKIHERFGDKVTVLGFPANNFLWQEPGTNAEIAEFCERNYGVKFQMFEKISVKGGDQHPLYRWLQAKTGEKPDWNFSKYLVSEDGTEVTFFKSSVHPMDESLIGRIDK
ncbi:MAG: glutathione peroxidase [Cytophagales bacterium]|nr:glutathione peroxidase [Cytophagales bacterium]